MFSFRGCNLNKHANFKDRFIANEKEVIEKKKKKREEQEVEKPPSSWN